VVSPSPSPSTPASPKADEGGDPGLERALADSRVLRDAPEAVIARALAVWTPRARPADSSLTSSPAKRLWEAVLSFDSHATLPQALGLRSTPAALRGAPRQLVYSAGGLDVDVRLLPPDAHAATWRVRGQVLGPVVDGVARLQHTGGTLTAELDEWLEFRFEALPEGACQITLDLHDRVLALPAFDLAIDPA
jgi:hypothetical protein